MGRRNSAFEDVIEIASRLPWQLSVSFATAAYLCLHYIASKTFVPSPTDVSQVGSVVTHQLWHTLAQFGQYLLPAAFLIGALASAVRNARTKRHYTTIQKRGEQASLLDTSWQDFEWLVAEHFKRRNFSVRVGGGARPDGGVDIELRKGSELTLVQCKQWRATKVGVSVVRELFGVMAAKGASGAIIVTSGQFTSDAEAFALGRNIQLLDGAQLTQEISAAQLSKHESHSRQSNDADDTTFQSCPICNSKMVRRTATKGRNAGRDFWGCSRFPSCKGTRSM